MNANILLRKDQKIMLTKEQIRAHIEQDGNLRWVKMAELLQDSPESCVDGRGHEGIVGMPGGNAGEFVLALAALEQACGRRLPLEKMDEMLDKYIKKIGKFYFHTDDHTLHDAGLTAAQAEKGPAQSFEWGELLKKFSDPKGIGCGHLRLMIQNPEQYGVRSELVQSIIKSIYRSLWTSQDIEFVVLEGGHNEGAVVNVEIDDEEIMNDTEIPAISPTVKGVQMFVNHPQAAEFMRKKISESIVAITGADCDQEKFGKVIRELGNRQLSATVGHLAKGLPVYTVVFKGGELVEIK